MNRTRARELAHLYLEKGDAKGWFEALYVEANGDEGIIPWADLTVNPHLAQWLEVHSVQGQEKTALIIGCGLGDDAEELSRRGFNVTAFDISEEAIQWAKRRFPASQVQYVVADLLDVPHSWCEMFDLVVEIYTFQVLPDELRSHALRAVASLVGKNGVLLVIARGREETDDKGAMPWPLSKVELDDLCSCGLELQKFEDYMDAENPPVRRFRAAYRR